MIKQLLIFNFQSHKDSHLEFTDGVNVIVGASDSGKSAIIRALKWLVWNRPSGEALRSTWGGKTEVELFTDDTHVVRSKDKEELYVLGDQHFKAFRTDVPKEIQDALNMTEINLQQQLDQPFLLSLSAGQVAEHFNHIAKLDQIDRGLSNINKTIRELEADRKYKQSDIEEKEKQVLQFGHLERFEAEIEVLEDLENRTKQKRNAITDLTAKINSLESILIDIGNMQDTLTMEKPVLDLLAQIDERNAKEENIGQLDIAIGKLETAGNNIKEYQEIIFFEKDVNGLLKSVADKKVLVEDHRLLSNEVRRLSDIKVSLEKGQIKIKNLQDMYNKNLKELGICPLCGSKIK